MSIFVGSSCTEPKLHLGISSDIHVSPVPASSTIHKSTQVVLAPYLCELRSPSRLLRVSNPRPLKTMDARLIPFFNVLESLSLDGELNLLRALRYLLFKTGFFSKPFQRIFANQPRSSLVVLPFRSCMHSSLSPPTAEQK